MRRVFIVIGLLVFIFAASTAYLALRLDVPAREGYFYTNGAFLRYLEWEPVNTQARGLVVLYHGYGGSAEMMGWLGVELARNGFLAVAFDNRGHGKSSSTFSFNASFVKGDFEELLRHVGYEGWALVLIGHSMGGSAVQSAARSGIPVYGLVVLASKPLPVAPVNRSLLVLGGLDEIFPPSSIQDLKLQGWDVAVFPRDDHLTILYDPGVIGGVLQWLIGSHVNYSGERIAVTLLRSVSVLLLLPLLPLLFTGERAPQSTSIFSGKFWFAALGGFLALPIYYLLSLAVPAPVAVYVVAVLYAEALGFLVVFAKRLPVVSPFARLSPQTLLASVGIALVSYVLIHEALQPFLNVEPSWYRSSLVLELLLLLLPPVSVSELFVRPYLGGSGRLGLFRVVALRIACFMTAWVGAALVLGQGGFTGYLLVVTLMSMLLILPIDAAASSWLARFPPAVNAIWVSLVLAVLLGAVSPVV